MSADAFTDAVREMRRLQKLYFGGRSVEVLAKAKAAEAVVDKMLGPTLQESLFPEGK